MQSGSPVYLPIEVPSSSDGKNKDKWCVSELNSVQGRKKMMINRSKEKESAPKCKTTSRYAREVTSSTVKGDNDTEVVLYFTPFHLEIEFFYSITGNLEACSQTVFRN